MLVSTEQDKRKDTGVIIGVGVGVGVAVVLIILVFLVRKVKRKKHLNKLNKQIANVHTRVVGKGSGGLPQPQTRPAARNPPPVGRRFHTPPSVRARPPPPAGKNRHNGILRL